MVPPRTRSGGPIWLHLVTRDATIRSTCLFVSCYILAKPVQILLIKNYVSRVFISPPQVLFFLYFPFLLMVSTIAKILSSRFRMWLADLVARIRFFVVYFSHSTTNWLPRLFRNYNMQISINRNYFLICFPFISGNI